MSVVEQLKEQLRAQIQQAVVKAELITAEQQIEVQLEKPKDGKMGDFSSNIAMQLTRIAKRNPREIAQIVVDNFVSDSVERVEIAGPGFINFYLKNDTLTQVVRNIIELDYEYGKSTLGANNKVNIEFVSANPTGDLHLGHARGAAIGDSLGRIMSAAGFDVTREYYINDAGNQINNLALSLQARYFQALGETVDMPEDGYHGQDIINIAEIVKENHKAEIDAAGTSDEQLAIFRKYGLKYELEKICRDLEAFGVPFDIWSSEQSLYDEKRVEPAIEKLTELGFIYEQDGATWFRTTDLGDDKDRVLKKTDGSFTYFTPDIAYHMLKLSRGYDLLIDIWGADHHGYIPRMKAAIQALTGKANMLEVPIIQMVRLVRDGEEVKMSKRRGDAVTIRDLVEMVGLDATRYFFAMRSADTQLDFDLGLAESQSSDNPVFYAQYAHARVSSILRNAAEQGVEFDAKVSDFSTLTHQKEINLMNKLGEFTHTVEVAATRREPHKITNYIHELASTFHTFYNEIKVIDKDDVAYTQQKLALVKAVQITLRNALQLVGVSAPERM
ncbi:MAG: arginine--tRNA ligase [Culicoidibacterales bacterium]